MNNELLVLIKKHIDKLIEQTKTRPQEALEFKINKQMQSFSFSPPINILEEGECSLGVSWFECTILFLLSLTKTTPFQSLYQVTGSLKLLKKLLKN